MLCRNSSRPRQFIIMCGMQSVHTLHRVNQMKMLLTLILQLHIFRLDLTVMERLRPLLPPQKPKTGRPAKDHRQVLNAILWILCTGVP